MSKFKWSLIAAVLFITLSSYLAYSWGVLNFVRSISRPIPKSINAHRNDDTFFKADAARGTVLLIHGLNFDASKMHPLAQVFVDQNFSVLVPRLAGHRGRIEETMTNPINIWMEQILEWNVTLPKPLICAGYSLGGLISVERALSKALNCDRFVLFAPALAIRTPHVLIGWLEAMSRKSPFKVPSGIPDGYMHFDHTGLGPTFALANVLESFDLRIKDNDTSLSPGLVFVDPRDEVIDPTLTQEKIRQYFPNWRIVPIAAMNLPSTHAFHLIVDEPHVGEENWQKIRDEIAAFLK